MSNRRLSYTEHLAFYQQQQLHRKRKQFKAMGHPSEATTTVEQPVPDPSSMVTAVDDQPGRQPVPTRGIPVTPPVEQTVRIRLHIDNGPDQGRVYALPEGEYVVGRAPDANIRLRDETISNHHARFVVTSGGTTVQDLDSRNGSKVCDVVFHGTVVVKPGDKVMLGETRVRVLQGD